jgi:hypothetical protein
VKRSPVIVAWIVGLALGVFLARQGGPDEQASVDGGSMRPLAQQHPGDGPVQAPDLQPVPLQGGDGAPVELTYDVSGTSMLVPVSFEGPGGLRLELDMLFDTGATLTTLDRDALLRLGVPVPADAPTIQTRTAAGPRRAPVVQVDRLWIGDRAFEGVTVSLCDACAIGGAAGLLGMNVSGRFLITIDTVDHLLSLQPRADRRGETADVAPWLTLEYGLIDRAVGRSEAEVVVRNAAARAVSKVTVLLSCDLDLEITVLDVPPAGRASRRETLPRGADCRRRFDAELLAAQW